MKLAESLSLFHVQLEPYDVNVSPDLQQQLNTVVEELGIQVPPPVSSRQVLKEEL